MRPWMISLVAALAGFFLLLVTMDQWRYVQEGHQYFYSLDGGPWESGDVWFFPVWRKVALWVISAVLAAGIGLSILARRSATMVLGAASIAVISLGVFDVLQFGILTSPSSLKQLGLVVGMFVAMVYRQRIGLLR